MNGESLLTDHKDGTAWCDLRKLQFHGKREAKNQSSVAALGV
jgi:hypothetical protein